MTVSAIDLCTIADVQAYVGQPAAPTDAFMQSLVTACSKFIQQFIGYNIASASYTDKFNGIGNTSRVLSVRPVISVQSVTIDATVIPQGAVPQTSGWFNDTGFVYLSGYSFNKGVQNCTIVFTAGYAAIPEDIKQVAIEMVANKYKRSQRIGVASTGIGRETITFNKNDLSDDSNQVLTQYQQVMIS